ncbi:MAG TPA: GH116 family glycosyl hydrolase [Puia sp.]|uniref:GH116 family glycosyl hydrolase n=1 Tax=Puia sp. TaxID=2045100 RepID=UPI002B822B5A|nr:GH116 family glycosyl hydrolase [Puia sp.]HVU95221.1 GH116 family glycosyl hydrolase [Puia sp.]
MPNNRRTFLKTVTIGSLGAAAVPTSLLEAAQESATTPPPDGTPAQKGRPYNTPYTGEYLNRVAFPIGGLGAGMFCLEGAGAVSHMSIRHHPEVYNEPPIFAALHVKALDATAPPAAIGAKVLEGPVPTWKYFGPRGAGNGESGATYGLPRFRHASFEARFPFATLHLHDEDLPIKATLTGWSPFIPTDEDNSSLPVGALEYSFVNTGNTHIDAVFSFNTKNFLHNGDETPNSIGATPGGFILRTDKPGQETNFAVFTTDDKALIDHCWFRGGWWDPLTMTWNTVKEGKTRNTSPVEKDAPGASLFVPFSLAPGATKTIKVLTAWYAPNSTLHIGDSLPESATYQPWYAGRFANIAEVIDYWRQHYKELKKNTTLFHDAFHASTLPPEVMEAVAANLTILKSPTVLRQKDGRLWSWEGCADENGCCHGSCTHVWNYAQAIPHLFPALERSLRKTEFGEDQNEEGHQTFRANLPISPVKHDFHAAADGQLGGIMKVYRDWRIAGDDTWLADMYPKVRTSMDYCIRTWDPRAKGVVEEPHHNTYDIEFWGADGMCTSFYLGALYAMTKMGNHLHQDISTYQSLYEKGRKYMETRLYDGEFFIQEIEYKGLNAPNPAKAQSYGGEYSPEAVDLLQKEGPKYQYGKGCLSDGVLGAWIGKMAGLEDFIDATKIKSHLLAIHRYNLRKDLSEHANPQRPAYALGHEGGLLLCTWPKGGRLSLPFVYSDEVWTGIEYQVASHLLLTGNIAQGLEIVRLCRDRYDGRIRNPFNEYECGHWYARAMSSYGLLQGLTGLRYDAVEKTLHLNSHIGDFTCFLSTATGFGTVTYKNGKAKLDVTFGSIPVQKIIA